MDAQCEKFTISGVVQGVGFRYYTSHEGTKLGLTGYAKNLKNGDVEVIVCGRSQQIAEMEKWLQVGPKTSLVSSVKSEPVPYVSFTDFEIS
ncbi:acylphosphatase [Vibrio hepatarius]|uniref:acylphosphatase n=1 Tax=Vibrio hepatarius TaxID=171383 RepID=UPI001C0A4F43|nr:acylphosphatase [Vibrio hepatarius]MBU2898847.1 acylphosphatase [Vibrio hepatarius]